MWTCTEICASMHFQPPPLSLLQYHDQSGGNTALVQVNDPVQSVCNIRDVNGLRPEENNDSIWWTDLQSHYILTHGEICYGEYITRYITHAILHYQIQPSSSVLPLIQYLYNWLKYIVFDIKILNKSNSCGWWKSWYLVCMINGPRPGKTNGLRCGCSISHTLFYSDIVLCTFKVGLQPKKKTTMTRKKQQQRRRRSQIRKWRQRWRRQMTPPMKTTTARESVARFTNTRKVAQYSFYLMLLIPVL